MKNVVLKKEDRIKVKKLLSWYIYLTSDDVERDEEGYQYYEDAKEYVADEYAVSWIQAGVIVNKLLDEVRKEKV
jgi:hypothetical protein